MKMSGCLYLPADLFAGNNPGTHQIGSWLSPRACLDVFAFTGIRAPDCSVRGLVPILIVIPPPDKERVRRIVKYLAVSRLTCFVRGYVLGNLE